MKVSVVVPARDEEKYLAKTLQNINHLEIPPNVELEVLVVDGGSVDKTAQIAKEHFTKVLTIEPDGIGRARQFGLKNASGEIVAFTDADTLLPKNWLVKILPGFDDPKIACVYGFYQVEPGISMYQIYVNYLQPVFMKIMHFLHKPLIPGQNSAFRQTLALEAGGFDETLPVMEDSDLGLRLARKYQVKLVKNPVFSSARRKKEGFGFFTRAVRTFFSYFFSGRPERFPDFR